ncbi:MAG TPA: Tol-Pal system beta propeller repeat protein TolB [Thermoanaerobaculia bacterium]|nr:Tol-Pal system beta propeller repeat protein TolB [Thermoanaerobaculia bacterium]
MTSSPRGPLTARLGAGLLLLVIALPAAARQDEGDRVTAVLSGDQRAKVRLAFPASARPPAPPPEAERAIGELEATLRNDLVLSGIFDVAGPEELSAARITGDRDQDFEQYRALGNEVVLLNEMKLEGDKVVLEGVLYDLASKSFILGKSYTATFDLARTVAHTFSDEIVLYFSGRKGIALTAIAFTSDRDDSTGRNKELYLMDYDGFDQRRISGHQSLTLAPDWAPNGEDLAYVSFYQGPASLYRVERATGAKREILVDDVMSTSPSFSPDGSRIAFGRSVEGNVEIFTVDRNGGNLKRITNSGGIDTNPAWSRNGRQIAFTSSRSGSPQIYLMDVDGSNVRRVTLQGSYNDGASWHPDGSRITFSKRTRDGSRFDVAVLDLGTLEEASLTQGPGSHEHPEYSPDGRFIVFESSRSGSRQIFVMNEDGGNLRQLTTRGGNSAPSWSPYLE